MNGITFAAVAFNRTHGHKHMKIIIRTRSSNAPTHVHMLADTNVYTDQNTFMDYLAIIQIETDRHTISTTSAIATSELATRKEYKTCGSSLLSFLPKGRNDQREREFPFTHSYGDAGYETQSSRLA